MKMIHFTSGKKVLHGLSVLALSLVMFFGTTTGIQAEEADAKRILKAMSDYMAAQEAISFSFDATLEVVTLDKQKIGLASSGSLNLKQPDKMFFARTGGFTNIELFFDGKKLTLLGKNLNVYTQLEVEGTIDHLIDELKDTYNQPLPAADLLLSNSYEELMRDVVDVKDLGTGVIGGTVCDHLAFRTNDVDWQIWIAQGEQPYPCRYVITSKLILGEPQYSVHFRDWQTGGAVAAAEYSFKNQTNADKVDFKELKGADDLPDHFSKGDSK